MCSPLESADSVTPSSPESLSLQLVLLLIIQLLGLLLNLTVLFVIGRRYRFLKRKKRYILLTNILLCDLILLTWVMPATARLITCNSPECLSAIVGGTVCSVTAFLFQFSYVCSFLTHALLALERACSTLLPGLLTTRAYVGGLVVSWLLSGAHAALPLSPGLTGVAYVFNDQLKRCSLPVSCACWYSSYLTLLLQAVIAPVVPGSYSFLCYKIWRLRARVQKPADGTQQPAGPAIYHRLTLDVAHENVLMTSCGSPSTGHTPGHTTGHTPSHTSGHTPGHPPDVQSPVLRASPSPQAQPSSQAHVSPEFVHTRRGPRPTMLEQATQTSLPYVPSELSGSLSSHSNLSSSFSHVTHSSQSGRPSSSVEVSETQFLKSGQVWKPESQLTSIDALTSVEPQQAVPRPCLARLALGCLTDKKRHLMRACWPESTDPLEAAIRLTLHKGICLALVVYVCSLPYAMVSGCPRGDAPWEAGITSMWLYYSTSVWYPVLYFYWHDSFVEHLRLSISTL